MKHLVVILLLLGCKTPIFTGQAYAPASFSICDGTVFSTSNKYYVSNVIIETGGEEYTFLNPERKAIVTLPDTLVEAARASKLFTIRVELTHVKKQEKFKYGILSYLKKGELCEYRIPAFYK